MDEQGQGEGNQQDFLGQQDSLSWLPPCQTRAKPLLFSALLSVRLPFLELISLWVSVMTHLPFLALVPLVQPVAFTYQRLHLCK